MVNEDFLRDLINLGDLTLNSVFDTIDSNVQYLFKNLTNLKKLKLTRNFVEYLKSTFFEFLVKLEELILCSNRIKVIEPLSFKNLKNLSNIELSKNSVKELDKIISNGISNLKRLELFKFGHGLGQLKKETLSNMNKLEKVSFNYIDTSFDLT